MRKVSTAGVLIDKAGVLGSFFLQASLCALLATQSQADFYRFTADDGVETYTNTPASVGGVKVLREGKPGKEVRSEAKAAPKTELPRKSELPFSAQEPLLPVTGTVTSKVGWRHDPIDGGIRHHNGVDIAVPIGTRVKAIAAGRVVESAWRGGYGNLVTIDHGDGMISLYGHNSRLEVMVGDQVEAGQCVALSGATGRSTGPHLHFELWNRGNNVTEAYLSTGAGIPEVTGGIRSYLHSDGSIVFTNR